MRVVGGICILKEFTAFARGGKVLLFTYKVSLFLDGSHRNLWILILTVIRVRHQGMQPENYFCFHVKFCVENSENQIMFF